MAHGMYHYIQKAWKKPDKETLRKRMTEWRKSGVFTRVDKPLRLDKARAIGYQDKKGIVVIRVRIKRGGHKRTRPKKGRRGKRMHTRKNLQMNYKWIAEQRVQRKYKNLEVLNSYPIGKDGMNYFYEVILIDSGRPEIKSDKKLNWASKGNNKKRAMRGLTSSARKSRGLRYHFKEKKRPNIRKSMQK
jgi:large subunit ribosomal protein L15e